ncbi:MAG: ATP-binding protein [Thermoplasmata archaeon]
MADTLVEKSTILAEYVKRDLEDQLWRYMDSPEIVAVVGPRQAGKTTLLYKIHTELKNSNFISFEDRDALNLFEEDEKEFAELYLKDYDHLLIDEFQYAEEGGRKLKYLYDHYNKKILITGSSAIDMTVKGLKHLTGRVFKFKLFPFSFNEFLRYKNQKLYKLYSKKDIEGWVYGKKDITISKTILEQLEGLRKEYAIYGGYPRVVLSETKEEKRMVLKNIVDTYLIREIRGVLGITEDREILNLMKLLAVRMSEIINYTAVCEKGGFQYNDLKGWLNILEHTFVLEQVTPYYTNKQKEVIKAPKIYFHDNGFRNAILNSFDLRQDRGELNENFFFTQVKKQLKYWRTKSKAEVDFVLEKKTPIPFEIKTVPKITRSFRSFMDKYQPELAFVMNEREFKKDENIFFVPLIFSQRITDLL